MQILSNIKTASKDFVDQKTRNKVLETLIEIIINKTEDILSENQKDLSNLDQNDPCFDRVKLTQSRIDNICAEIGKVISLPSPLNKTLYEHEIQSGFKVKKITVPLGVVGIIYEARPNVTIDAFCLCFKSGNACLLKGGKEAIHSNEILVQIIKKSLEVHKCNKGLVELINLGRDELLPLLRSPEYIDLLIPRGGKNLIDFVRTNANVPVIETGAGVVHIYLDRSFDHDVAREVIFNAKTRRVSVCNTLDTLIIHEDALPHLSPVLKKLSTEKVLIFADDEAHKFLHDYPYLEKAAPQHFETEFLDYKMAIKTVNSITKAIEHIEKHSAKNSEAIISTNQDAINYFFQTVDSAAIYSNASTSFTDGAQFGLGAEIGISTQKLHARGPMGLESLVTTKYLASGHGNIRTP